MEDRENSRNTSRISEEAAALLYGKEIFGSVTRLEQFAKCPYAHFIIFGLGLSQREEFRVEAYDYGNVFHRSLEHFSHMLEEQQKTWQDLTEEEIFSMTEECVDRALEYKDQMFYQTRRVSYMAVRMKRIMGRSVWGMWKQMKKGNFEARYSEKQFPGRENLETAHIPLDGDKSMVITGKIDRVDTCDSEGKRLVKILDYKSGSNDLALDRIYYGLQMQLVAYMTAALELEEKNSLGTEAVPAAMLYYRLQEPELEWKSESGQERENRLLKEMKCTGFANADPVILEKLDHNLARGGDMCPGASSAVVPVSVNKKDGNFSKNSHVLSTDEFGELMAHTRKKMKEFGNRIYQGEIQAEPYAMKAESGCDYCDLKGICGVEARDRVRYAKEYPAMNEEEVWEVLHGKNPVDK